LLNMPSENLLSFLQDTDSQGRCLIIQFLQLNELILP
jgi:hypothetical protein